MEVYCWAREGFWGSLAKVLEYMEVPRMTRLGSSRPEPCSGACALRVPFAAIRLRLQLAKVCLTPRRYSDSRQLLREIDDVPSYRPALGILVDQVEEFRRVLHRGDAAVTF